MAWRSSATESPACATDCGGRVTFATPPWRTTMVGSPSRSSRSMATPSSRAGRRAGLRRDREPALVERDARADFPGPAAGNHDHRAWAAHGERQIGGLQLAPAERIFEPDVLQIGSSHLTTTDADGAPGGSTTSRRTSRKPVRVPTTV